MFCYMCEISIRLENHKFNWCKNNRIDTMSGLIVVKLFSSASQTTEWATKITLLNTHSDDRWVITIKHPVRETNLLRLRQLNDNSQDNNNNTNTILSDRSITHSFHHAAIISAVVVEMCARSAQYGRQCRSSTSHCSMHRSEMRDVRSGGSGQRWWQRTRRRCIAWGDTHRQFIACLQILSGHKRLMVLANNRSNRWGPS